MCVLDGIVVFLEDVEEHVTQHGSQQLSRRANHVV